MKKCFVIMPFSKTKPKRTEQYWTDHYKNYLKPKIESFAEINVSRAKPIRGQILSDIINDLISADIVIADLTDNNPNVFYELGIRQSFKHGTITIAEYGSKLPFDIKGKGVLFYYPNNITKNADFEQSLKESILDCINHPNKTDSIVLETISGRSSFYELVNREEIIRRLLAISSEFKRNKESLKTVFEIAKKKKEKTYEGFPTDLSRFSCIELLVTNRYISESDEFYIKCEKYYEELLTINSRLKAWPSRDKAITEWLIKIEPRVNKLIEEFRIAIWQTIQNKEYNK